MTNTTYRTEICDDAGVLLKRAVRWDRKFIYIKLASICQTLKSCMLIIPHNKFIHRWQTKLCFTFVFFV